MHDEIMFLVIEAPIMDIAACLKRKSSKPFRRAEAANRLYNYCYRRLTTQIQDALDGQRDYLSLQELEEPFKWQKVQHELEVISRGHSHLA